MGNMGNAKPDAAEKRVRRHVTGRAREYFAIVHPGFESCCQRELIDLGIDASDICIETGGLAFAGRFVDCQRANLYLCTATRFLMRIDSFDATNLRTLKKQTAAIPWELFLPAGEQPRIQATSRRSRLYHTAAVSQAILEGIGRSFGDPPPSDPVQTLFVRIADDRATLSLDSSGTPLYKRGIKQGPARAPLRETLAAAILMTAGYDGSRPLVDPMCGSGSFTLEAAMLSKRMAPGARRNFAFTLWPAFGGRQWTFLKRQAVAKERLLERPRIFASDVDGEACRQLSETISENGLSDAVVVSHDNFFDCQGDQYGGRPGLVTINPPYGIRIGSTARSTDLFARICSHLKEAFRGWGVALIAPRRDVLKTLPFAVRQIPLRHGGLQLTLLVATLP